MSVNNDLISRSALMENIKKSRKALASVRSRLTVGDMEQMINGVRPVDAEVVRHGRWDSEVVKCRDWKGRQRDYFQPHSCSLCHKPDPSQGKSNYCPNCGAKMDGEHNDIQRV